jgi:hypothetical protein
VKRIGCEDDAGTFAVHLPRVARHRRLRCVRDDDHRAVNNAHGVERRVDRGGIPRKIENDSAARGDRKSAGSEGHDRA